MPAFARTTLTRTRARAQGAVSGVAEVDRSASCTDGLATPQSGPLPLPYARAREKKCRCLAGLTPYNTPRASEGALSLRVFVDASIVEVGSFTLTFDELWDYGARAELCPGRSRGRHDARLPARAGRERRVAVRAWLRWCERERNRVAPSLRLGLS